MITTFEIDQAKVRAPGFPRPLAWWRGFVPMWAQVADGPNGTVRVWIEGDRKCGQTLGRWLRTVGTTGRLANAVTEVEN